MKTESIKDILIGEHNKRIEERRKVLEEQDSKIKQKIEQYDKLLDSMKKVEELNKNMEQQTNELSTKLDTILEKENQMFTPDYVIELEDGSIELVRKDDVEIVNDEDVVRKMRE